MKPICVIPARGGSKRIPRKNIIDFNGHPMIAWPIKIALQSELFAEVVVSTDDDEIAEISREHGASVPFIREANLADDYATTADVLKDALSRLQDADVACCIYPTAPMIKAEQLRHAYEIISSGDTDCVMSVTDFDFHPLRALKQNREGRVQFNYPEYALTRSQDLPQMVHDAGAFYFFRTDSFLKSGNLIGSNTIGINISRIESVDIDTKEDLEIAKIIHSNSFRDKKNK